MTYTEGICSDGAAILKDGAMVPIEDVVARLNTLDRYQDALLVIFDLSDSEMRDGDGARDIAENALGNRDGIIMSPYQRALEEDAKRFRWLAADPGGRCSLEWLDPDEIREYLDKAIPDEQRGWG